MPHMGVQQAGALQLLVEAQQSPRHDLGVVHALCVGSTCLAGTASQSLVGDQPAQYVGQRVGGGIDDREAFRIALFEVGANMAGTRLASAAATGKPRLRGSIQDEPRAMAGETALGRTPPVCYTALCDRAGWLWRQVA